MKNVLSEHRDKIMKEKAFCGKQNRDYAVCIKTIVNFLVAVMHKMDSLGYFFVCVHISECWSLKG